MIIYTESIEYCLDGSFVRIVTTSGDTRTEAAISVANFERAYRRAGKVIAEWHARKVEPTPIAKSKRR